MTKVWYFLKDVETNLANVESCWFWEVLAFCLHPGPPRPPRRCPQHRCCWWCWGPGCCCPPPCCGHCQWSTNCKQALIHYARWRTRGSLLLILLWAKKNIFFKTSIMSCELFLTTSNLSACSWSWSKFVRDKFPEKLCCRDPPEPEPGLPIRGCRGWPGAPQHFLKNNQINLANEDN